MDQAASLRDDGTGGVRLSLWNHPGDGIYGMFARSHRIVDAVEQLLEDEVYHYHSKMILKDAKVGGAWAWHQDYGYWYQNGLLFPDLCSVMIAVDKATEQNGCLQVLQGSHRMGRVNHILSGDQAGRPGTGRTRQRFPLIHCSMDAGDALFSIPIFSMLLLQTSQIIHVGIDLLLYAQFPYKNHTIFVPNSTGGG